MSQVPTSPIGVVLRACRKRPASRPDTGEPGPAADECDPAEALGRMLDDRSRQSHRAVGAASGMDTSSAECGGARSQSVLAGEIAPQQRGDGHTSKTAIGLSARASAPPATASSRSA